MQTFDNSLEYTGEFIDVTSDVEVGSVGTIRQKLDNNNFDVGAFRYSDFSFTIDNTQGKYGEPGVLQSIFTDKRIDSLVKVTWSMNDIDDINSICGLAIAGDCYLSDEENVFYGLLNDVATTQNITDNKLKFSVQGIESIFSKIETNYSALSVSDTLSATIYKLLNQTGITNRVNVAALNIVCGIDQVPDDISKLENTTVKESLDILLEYSNSVLWVDVATQTVYVKPRTPQATISKTFYGQAANTGSEDVVSISAITTGANKTFNYWKWSNSAIISKDVDSISRYGVRKKDISTDIFTNNTKQLNILTNYKDEFYLPKREMTLSAILDYSTIDLFIMDRINVDYPAVLESANEADIPRYGIAKYGESVYPVGTWLLTLRTNEHFKIIGRTINFKTGIVDYNLREV